MPDTSPSPFDDELLSAYLDDEVTPEERARVDERLAADPAARQLLDELRSVSRAMKELPAATLGTDLRESVLRRAERAMLVSGELASASGKEKFTTSFPIGRSKRAWFWAGAALAAGLMLMIFQRDPARDAGLTSEVAKSERESDSGRNQPLSRLESRAAESAVEQPVEPLADNPVAAPAVANQSLAGNTSGQLAKETLSVSAERETGPPMQPGAAPDGGMGGGAGGMVLPQLAAGVRSKEVQADMELLVVHVNMKPEAMRGRAFDHLLRKNQIAIEQETADESAAPPATQQMEMVVVEAVPTQLAKCLDEIKKDETNYLGVAVDDRLANSQRVLAENRPEADMKQYNRGVVPNQQQVEFAADSNSFYYGMDTSESQVTEQSPPQSRTRQFLARDAAPPAPAATSAAPTSPSDSSAARAGDVVAPVSGADEEGDTYLGAKLNIARRAVQRLEAKADTLQVLFVLTCPSDHAAPSQATSATPATASPELAAPAEEGLKSSE